MDWVLPVLATKRVEGGGLCCTIGVPAAAVPPALAARLPSQQEQQPQPQGQPGAEGQAQQGAQQGQQARVELVLGNRRLMEQRGVAVGAEVGAPCLLCLCPGRCASCLLWHALPSLQMPGVLPPTFQGSLDHTHPGHLLPSPMLSFSRALVAQALAWMAAGEAQGRTNVLVAVQGRLAAVLAIAGGAPLLTLASAG